MANPDADGLTTFAEMLTESGHILEVVKEPFNITERLPWDIIILPFPKERFTIEEMMALQSHLRDGSSILLLAEWGDLFGHADYLNELTKPYGIEIQKDRVTDHSHHITQKVELGGVVLGEQDVPHYVLIDNFSDHPITRGVEGIIYFSGCSLRVSEPAVVVASTSESSFGDLDLNAVLDDDEEQGVLPIAAASEMTGRLLVVGDSNIAANGYIEQGDNRRFMGQAIEWLSFQT